MKQGFGFRAIVLCLAFAGQAHAQYWQGPIGVNFSATSGGYWGRAVTIEGDFLRWLGAARLQTAQAAYWQAQAAGQWQRARGISTAITAMQWDLRRANQYIINLNRNMIKVDRYVRQLNGFTTGQVPTSAMIATRALLSLLPGSVVEHLLSEAATIPAVSAADFKPYFPMQTSRNPETGEQETHEIVLQDFAGGNIFAFVAWLSRVPLKATMGSAGHAELMRMRNILRSGADSWYNRIVGQRSEYEDRYQDIYQAVAIGDFSYPERRLP